MSKKDVYRSALLFSSYFAISHGVATFPWKVFMEADTQIRFHNDP